MIDLLLGLLSYLAAWVVRIQVALPFTATLLPEERWEAVDHPLVVLLGTQVLIPFLFGLYDDLRTTRYREVVAYVSMACTLQVVTLASFFFLSNAVFPRTVILIFGCFNCVAFVVWRLNIKHQLQSQSLRVLLVGWSEVDVLPLASEIEKAPWMRLEIIGAAVCEGEGATGQAFPYPVLGSTGQIQELIAAHSIDQVIFASTETWKDDVLASLSQVRELNPIRIAIQPSFYEIAIGRLRHLNIDDAPLIEVRRDPGEPFERFVKRLLDLGFAGLLLILLSPLLVGIAVLILVTSGWPALYSQDRVGRWGRIFRLKKFRTMIADAERFSGEILASENDPRVTTIGAILRRSRLDELPQLINVLMGDMSFVGPRPERPGFVEAFSTQLRGYNERHKVKPGITGLAQVRGFYRTSAEKKLKYDLAYIYNYSFSLDLLILLETVKVMLVRRGS